MENEEKRNSLKENATKLHNDTKCSHMEQFVDVNEHVQARASIETKAHKRSPLDQKCSRYTLKVHPSEDTEARYRSNKPAICAALVCIAFLLTTVIFLVCDYLIAKRQKIVMDRGIQSGAIVALLFPENVRDRMHKENKVRSGTSGAWSNRSGSEDDEAKNDTVPNADVFQSTTVLFGNEACICFASLFCLQVTTSSAHCSIPFVIVCMTKLISRALQPGPPRGTPHKCLLCWKLFTLRSIPSRIDDPFSKLRWLGIAM